MWEKGAESGRWGSVAHGAGRDKTCGGLEQEEQHCFLPQVSKPDLLSSPAHLTQVLWGPRCPRIAPGGEGERRHSNGTTFVLDFDTQEGTILACFPVEEARGAWQPSARRCSSANRILEPGPVDRNVYTV